MVMGATDGKSLRAAGIPTYGVQGFFMDRNDLRFHGRDERMSVQSFYEGQTFLYELVKILSKAGESIAALPPGSSQDLAEAAVGGTSERAHKIVQIL
jgi:hypothetical protein